MHIEYMFMYDSSYIFVVTFVIAIVVSVKVILIVVALSGKVCHFD